jgi:transcriptional activator SPT8
MDTPQASTTSSSKNDLSRTATVSRSTASAQPSDTVSNAEPQPPADSDANSEASFDPLFDDEPDASEGTPVVTNGVALPLSTQAPRSAQSQPPQRTQVGHVAPPKNAPPLLDPTEYATFSPDLLMTAAIDGQIILWDKRVSTVGKGVGRLWMSEKTPPWCLSVIAFHYQL